MCHFLVVTVVTHFWNQLRKLLRLLRETSKQPGPNRCRSVPGGSFSPQPLCMLFRQSSVYTSAANDQCDVRTVNSWYSVLILVFITGSSPAQHKCTDPLFYPFFSYLSRSVSLSITWNNANRHIMHGYHICIQRFKNTDAANYSSSVQSSDKVLRDVICISLVIFFLCFARARSFLLRVSFLLFCWLFMLFVAQVNF